MSDEQAIATLVPLQVPVLSRRNCAVGRIIHCLYMCCKMQYAIEIAVSLSTDHISDGERGNMQIRPNCKASAIVDGRLRRIFTRGS
jgi:hypothetical protein